MNKVFALLLVLFLMLASATPALAQCDPATDPLCVVTEIPTEGFVVPSELVMLFAAVITYFVTNGLKSTGLPIEGVSSKITAAIVFSFVTFSNSLLSQVPVGAQPAISGAFMLIIGVLSAYGIHYSMKKPKIIPGELVELTSK